MHRFFMVGLLLLVLSVLAAPAFADESGTFYLVPVQTRAQVDLLGLVDAPIRHRLNDGVVMRLTPDELARLNTLGFSAKALDRDPALPSLASLRAETFHDNDGVKSVLDALAAARPDLAERFSLGQSVQGRTIHGIRISADIGTEQDEMELRIVGCHHGNEFMSVEISLLLARDLIEGYDSDRFIKNLLNNTAITIVPLVNPDGRQAGSRYNANNVDLNRVYGYQYRSGISEGDGRNSGAFSQPEVRAVVDDHLQRNYTLSFSYHTTADYVNYVWNYTPNDPVDEPLIFSLSELYAAETGYTSVQGFDWYQTFGDTNDWSYGAMGAIDTTIETENSNIPATYAKNREGLFAELAAALDARLHGVVTDAQSGDGLPAMILVDDPHWPVYTDPLVGDYHRLLAPGDYAATVWSPGYAVKRVSATVSEGAPTRLDVALEAGGGYHAYRVLAIKTHSASESMSPSLLGPPDSDALSLYSHGWVVADMWTPMRNGPGDELEIIEGPPYEGERYRVYVSDDYADGWLYVGEGQGDTALDLSSVAGLSPRFVRIEDLGDAAAGQSRGADLDALSYYPPSAPTPVGQCSEDFDCVELSVSAADSWESTRIRGPVQWLDDCSFALHAGPLCVGDLYRFALRIDGASLIGPQNCRFSRSGDASRWIGWGDCGAGANTVFSLKPISCDGLSVPVVSHACTDPPLDGDYDADPESDGGDSDEGEHLPPDGDIDPDLEPEILPDGDGPMERDREAMESDEEEGQPADGDAEIAPDGDDDWTPPIDGDGWEPERPDVVPGSGGSGGCGQTQAPKSAEIWLVLMILAGIVRRRARKA